MLIGGIGFVSENARLAVWVREIAGRTESDDIGESGDGTLSTGCNHKRLQRPELAEMITDALESEAATSFERAARKGDIPTPLPAEVVPGSVIADLIGAEAGKGRRRWRRRARR